MREYDVGRELHIFDYICVIRSNARVSVGLTKVIGYRVYGFWLSDTSFKRDSFWSMYERTEEFEEWHRRRVHTVNQFNFFEFHFHALSREAITSNVDDLQSIHLSPYVFAYLNDLDSATRNAEC